MLPYKCTICERENVKLWRPYMDIVPLVCATCAERMQSIRWCDEVVWRVSQGGYAGIPTGNKCVLPSWTVNEDGVIPGLQAPGPGGIALSTTDQLMVDLSWFSQTYANGFTCMVPAIPSDDGTFLGYENISEISYQLWKSFPTR